VAIDPRNGGTIYAGTSNGVWRSVDGGAHWSALNSGLPMIGGVNALAIDPQTGAVYAATSGGGVFAISFAP
jgi:hypothetical protein